MRLRAGILAAQRKEIAIVVKNGASAVAASYVYSQLAIGYIIAGVERNAPANGAPVLQELVQERGNAAARHSIRSLCEGTDARPIFADNLLAVVIEAALVDVARHNISHILQRAAVGDVEAAKASAAVDAEIRDDAESRGGAHEREKSDEHGNELRTGELHCGLW